MGPSTAEQAVKTTGKDACNDKVMKLYIVPQGMAPRWAEDKGVFNSEKELGALFLFPKDSWEITSEPSKAAESRPGRAGFSQGFLGNNLRALEGGRKPPG
jgi:hypothetical protein